MKYKLATFDMDGTIIDEIESVWNLIHSYYNIDLIQNKKISDLFFSGKMSYPEWVEHDVGLWVDKKATKSELLTALNGTKLMKGTLNLLDKLQKENCKIALISGGLDIVLDSAFPNYEQYFNYVFVNKLKFNNDLLIGATPTKYDSDEKAEGLVYIAQKENINLNETLFIGDGSNDVKIAQTAGFSIAFNSKHEKLKNVSNVVINEKDLTKVLNYIQ